MLPEILQQTLIITAFVMVMMLIIEVINVQSKGKWFDKLTNKPILQNLLGTVLGGLPGCLGTYTAVSLYSHKGLNFAALLTTMIVTTGDEAFLMLSLIPLAYLKITVILIVLGVVMGLIWNKININWGKDEIENHKLEIHEHQECIHWEKSGLMKNIKNISFPRAILSVSLILFIWGLLSGGIHHSHDIFPAHSIEKLSQVKEVGTQAEHDHHSHDGHTHDIHAHDIHDHAHAHDHNLEQAEVHAEHNHSHDDHGNWFNITLIGISIIALILILIVPDHFLEDHLWKHIIKKHALKIFLWTLIVLGGIYYLQQHIDLTSWVSENYFKVLLLAIIVGIIPQSGPHYIFILLFFQGSIPLSILLANSIVQDGHGALPLLAESKKSFIQVKAVKAVIALIFGIIGYWLIY